MREADVWIDANQLSPVQVTALRLALTAWLAQLEGRVVVQAHEHCEHARAVIQMLTAGRSTAGLDCVTAADTTIRVQAVDEVQVRIREVERLARAYFVARAEVDNPSWDRIPDAKSTAAYRAVKERCDDAAAALREALNIEEGSHDK